MATELTRRRAVQSHGRMNKTLLKETRSATGSTTGAFETFFLTSICPPQVAVFICDYLFDGGVPNSEFCPILDADEDIGILYDAGGPNTIVCGV